MARCYTVRPLPAAQLPNPFVYGFQLTERTQTPHPVYLVRLAADGAINCSCPHWQKGAETCKHAECLRAAALLPVDLVQLVHSYREMLVAAEAKAERLEGELAAARAPKPRRSRKKV